MQFDAELLLIAMAPVFLACIGWEAWHLARTRPAARIYSWRDTLCNAALALMHQGADKLAWIAVVPVYAYVYKHFRLVTWQPSWLSIAVLFVAQDFLYYVFHRMSHRVRWLWAAHVVHHSSERLNLSTAFRQSLMYPLAGMWVFWTPLALLGFPAQQVVAIVLVNLSFQFFVHTQAIGRLGWLEVRAQHAVDPPLPPRAQRTLHRPQLCGRARHLGPALRQLRRRGSRRAARVRHRRTGADLQSA
jgi:sterol desaturase/sphingolipid hydroxylase (fatty acid hydroxylase superfamily)